MKLVKDFATATTGKKHSSLKRYLLGGLIFSVIIGLIVVVLQSLKWSSFFSAEGQQTVLFFTEEVDQQGAYLVRFYFDNLQVEIYPIDSEVPTEVMGGYGNYRFQAVYPLLKLEGKDRSYIRSTMSLSMGILLDELWPTNTSNLELNNGTQLKSLLLTKFWHNWQIPLSRKLAWLSLLLDQRTEITVYEPVGELPAPVFLEQQFSQSEPLCTVALVNTTQMNGLAARIAQLLESHNFRIVRTISDDSLVGQTTAITTDEVSQDCQLVLEKITSLVPGAVKQQANEAETVKNRADLVVKLGTDLVQ